MVKKNKTKSSPLTFDDCFSSDEDYNDTYHDDQIKNLTNSDIDPDDYDNEDGEHNVDAIAINFSDNKYVRDKLICFVCFIFMLSFDYIKSFKQR